MYYAQFYQPSATNPADLIEACGDRSVIIMDGREGWMWRELLAAEECAKRGYVAFRLMRGQSFTRSAPDGALKRIK